MIRAIYQESDQQVSTLSEAEIPEVMRRGAGCLWVDLQGEANPSTEAVLRDTFGFHPLAVEDALQHSHIPKLDDWRDYLSMVIHTVRPSADGGIADTSEIDVFVGKHFIVTYQAEPTVVVEEVWEGAGLNRSIMSRGSAHVLYRLIDKAEAEFAPLFDGIDEQVSRIENEVFERPTSSLLAEIFALKRSLLGLRRVMSPQREVIGKLARGAHEQFSAEERMYFHDVYDHMIQLGEMLEILRDTVSSALEIYLSAVSNHLNDVLKTLTIITTLFMPLTFIVGFFGMNFFQSTVNLGPWTGRSVFLIAMTLMVVTPLLMYWWIRRRAWV